MNLLREYIRRKLIEQSSGGGLLIVVDIQPEYESGATFDIGDMLRAAAEYDEVLFLYNGADTLGMIDEASLKNYYFEKLDYDEEVFHELMSVSEFFDKGYGFFRDVMDSNICFDRNSVIKIVKYMIDNDVQDIRELEEEDVEAIGVNELLFDDLEDYGFWVPELQGVLPRWNGSDIAGGARNECLAEVEILAAAQGLSFNQVDQFIYEGDDRYTEGVLTEKYIRKLVQEQNVLATGMCFPFAYQKAEEWFEKYYTKGRPGRSAKKHPELNDKSKFKVVHGTVTNKWKSPSKPVVHGWVEMGDLVFDDQTKVTKPNGVDKEVYYDMYQPEVYKEFTAEEAILNCAMKGGEGPWDDDLYAMLQDRDAWMKESRVREYVRALLKEDPMGFVHDLAAASEEFGEPGEMFFGGNPGKGGGKAIKRAFNANADHAWLATLDTVHWGDIYGLAELVGKSKDELSTNIVLPGEDFHPAGNNTGLWVKGRITLAGGDMDQLYTGHYDDYGPGKEGTEEEVTHRDKSSGRNKRPTVSKDYSRYGQLKRGTEFAEKMARNIPYILDQSMWNKEGMGANEALVDNWKPLGLIPNWEVIQILRKLNKGRELDEDPPGSVGKLFKLAREMGIPIFDRERNILWSPDEAS